MIAGFDPLTVVGAVLLVVLGLLSWLTRRVQGGSLRGVGERVALTSQHSVHVVELAGVRMLVGTGPSGAPRLLAALGEVEQAEDTGRGEAAYAEAAAGRGWTQLLARLGADGGR